MWDRPLVVQSDRTLLLEVAHPLAEQARTGIAQFAELLKSPDYIHTYQMSSLSLWNACALGWTSERVAATLQAVSRYAIPAVIEQFIEQEMGKYGKLVMKRSGKSGLVLEGDGKALAELRYLPGLMDLVARSANGSYTASRELRGEIKRLLVRQGFPVLDMIGYDQTPLLLPQEQTNQAIRYALRPEVQLRDYQEEAVQSILSLVSRPDDLSGVILLPCGSGKTLVGLAIMGGLNTKTLIITPNLVALRQWKREAAARLNLPSDLFGEYSSTVKEIKPVTFTTYQMLCYQKNDRFSHFERLNREEWGLLLYDEVQLLPAPMFRLCAAVQGIRRVGLTATLVREDGAETDVFSLIGPKRFEVPWRMIEQTGYLAKVRTIEISVSMEPEDRLRYLTSSNRMKYRVAAENRRKLNLVRELVQQHVNERILIIGNYLNQLKEISRELGAPLLTGQTPDSSRDELYDQFRGGEIHCLVVSRVANVAVDLPDAQVAIQVSGQFGSRQEEAQRLGRILRPNQNGRES
ncbi:MAG: helicase, partial [Bacilli bacterium]|nr:helicase [Bacilli bacterium]